MRQGVFHAMQNISEREDVRSSSVSEDMIYMGVSKNRGTPKSSHFNRF